MGEDTHLSLLQDQYSQLAWFFGFPGAMLPHGPLITLPALLCVGSCGASSLFFEPP